MRRLFILTLLVLSFSYGETEFAEPKPSMENPRKFVFPMTKWDKNDDRMGKTPCTLAKIVLHSLLFYSHKS